MEPPFHSTPPQLGTLCVASDDDDYIVSGDDDENYSLSLSGLPEEENDADPALLSRALEDSVSFSFSIDGPFKTECSTLGFTESSLLPNHAHTWAIEPSFPCPSIMTPPHDEDEDSASLVPFKISGSWRAESSLRHYSEHEESRRSFSFSTDMEHETEHAEEIVIYAKSSTTERDLGTYDGSKNAAAHGAGGGTGGKHEVEGDADKEHTYRGSVFELQDGDDRAEGEYNVCTHIRNNEAGRDDRDVLSLHAQNDHEHHAKGALSDDSNVMCPYSRDVDSGRNDSNVLGEHPPRDHGKYSDHEHAKKTFSDDLSADSIIRFAGEGLLQPWSSSKLSKSCGHQAKAQKGSSQGHVQSSHVSSKNRNPFLSHPSDINKNFVCIDAHSPQPANRMRESFESKPFSPKGTSIMRGVGSPTHAHAPLYMPSLTRKTDHTGETLSLLLNAEKFEEAALSPPTSKGSVYSSSSNSNRTSSVGSTRSSGYSSSSGKSSTPASRHLSRNVPLVNVRCSLRQRMDEELHDPYAKLHAEGDPSCPLHKKGNPKAHLQRKEDPNAQLHRKGDPNAYVHKKGDPTRQIQQEGQAQPQSKKITDRLATTHGLMSPSMSPANSRSPLSWRAVLSLQPLNPSHVPLGEWELLGKPSSRSHSQRSRSSSRGSSGAGRRGSLMSAEFLAHPNCKQKSSKKEEMKANTKKMVSGGRRGYWGLNPMQWFRQCRDEKQVVDTCKVDSMKQKRQSHAV